MSLASRAIRKPAGRNEDFGVVLPKDQAEPGGAYLTALPVLTEYPLMPLNLC